jgi:hypothetical protein
MPALPNDRDERFCLLTVELNNGAEAYRQLYPTARNWPREKVTSNASNKMARPAIRARIAELRAERAEELRREIEAKRVKPERVVAELCHTAFFDPHSLFDANGNLLSVRDMPETARRAVKSVKVRQVRNRNEDGEAEVDNIVEVTLNDKLAALRQLGEHLGMYKQVVEHHWADDLRAMSDEELEREELAVKEALEQAMRERVRLDS